MTAEQIHDALTLLPADLIAEADKRRSGKPKMIVWKRYAAMAACFTLVLCSSLLCLRLFSPKGGSMESAPAEAAVMQASEEVNGFGADTALPETQAAAYSQKSAPEEDLCALPTVPMAEEGAAEDIRADATTKNSPAATGTLYAGMSQPRYVETPPYLGGTACFSGMPSPKLLQSRADLEAYRSKTPQRFELESLMAVCESYDDTWFDSHDLLLIPLCSVPVSKMPEVTAIYQEDGQWYLCMESDLDNAEAEHTDWHILIEVEEGLMKGEDTITLIYE